MVWIGLVLEVPAAGGKYAPSADDGWHARPNGDARAAAPPATGPTDAAAAAPAPSATADPTARAGAAAPDAAAAAAAASG